MLRITIRSDEDCTKAKWRFCIDAIDRNLEITVPELKDSKEEFVDALYCMLEAWYCRYKGHLTLDMRSNWKNFQDVCRGMGHAEIINPILHGVVMLMGGKCEDCNKDDQSQ